MQTLREAVIEYIDNLPEGAMTPELSLVWRMCDSANDAEQAMVTLRIALSSALDNLPNVAGDTVFGPDAIAECCKDVAALHHLLAENEDGYTNLEAYL